MQRFRTAFVGTFVLVFVLASVLMAAPAWAWTPKTQVSIAESAAQLAPPDLLRQIAKHRVKFREGVVGAFQDGRPERHYKDASGRGSVDAAWLQEADAAIAAIEAHRPFEEIVYRLGVMSHYLADANNPLNTNSQDRMEPQFFADFARYAESAEVRFRPVFYGIRPELKTSATLAPLMTDTLERGRRLYPLVGKEYRRFEAIDGRRNFDDRSTAFGVAALAYSHAVTDVAEALREIWIRAGGADTRPYVPERGTLLVAVPRAGLDP